MIAPVGTLECGELCCYCGPRGFPSMPRSSSWRVQLWNPFGPSTVASWDVLSIAACKNSASRTILSQMVGWRWKHGSKKDWDEVRDTGSVRSKRISAFTTLAQPVYLGVPWFHRCFSPTYTNLGFCLPK